MSHTPGPWDMQPSSDGAHSKRIFANGSYLATVGGSDQSWPELVANARLIAAAPEMYAALERVLATIENADEWWIDYPNKGGFDAIEIADVLAKAKGETDGKA